jgi:hypothetical protein
MSCCSFSLNTVIVMMMMMMMMMMMITLILSCFILFLQLSDGFLQAHSDDQNFKPNQSTKHNFMSCV